MIVATTVAFMAFNVAEGMLLIAAPWLAKHELPGGATMLGTLLAAMAAGEFIGAAVAGRFRGTLTPLRSIGIVQIVAASSYLALLAAPHQLAVGAGFFAVGLLSAPMTVWAQSLRMRRIPAELHGRAFALLRTLMQATLPLGSALVTPMLIGGHLALAAVVMTLIAGLPGIALVAMNGAGLVLPRTSAAAADLSSCPSLPGDGRVVRDGDRSGDRQDEPQGSRGGEPGAYPVAEVGQPDE